MTALSLALKYLKTRIRSAWEIDQALLRREVPQEEREKVLEELRGLDLVNDERFARAWVNTRDRLSPRGEAVLKVELMRKGIPKEIIDATLRNRREEMKDEDSDRQDDLALAREVLAGKERAYARLDPETRNRRLTSLLLRKGFSFDVARKALASLE